MKFDFWFDLPKALSDLSLELLSKDELDLCENIQINSKEIISKHDAFKMKYEKLSLELNQEENKILEYKINNLNKELVELVCLAIKLSIKIMSKLIKYITDENSFDSLDCNNDIRINNNPEQEIKSSETGTDKNNMQINYLNDKLSKTKIFLKMTRLIIENANYNVETKNGKSKEFFQMIQAFTEKIQRKLYIEANNLIKKSILKQITISKSEKLANLNENDSIKNDKIKTFPKKINDITI